MIKMTRGTYGLCDKGAIIAMTRRSAPFSLSPEKEKRLVDAGVAVFVPDIPDKKPEYRQQTPRPTAKPETKAEMADKAPEDAKTEE